MENEKKIPWWVSSSRRGLGKDNNMIILGFVFWGFAVWCFVMFSKNNKPEAIIYGIALIVVGLKYFGSYFWLKKNNLLEN